MYCKECGTEINDKAVVCVKCGCATGNPQVNAYNIASRKISGYGFHSTGRASRTTYWISQLILFALMVVLTISLFVIGALVIGNSMNNLFYDNYYYDFYSTPAFEAYETIVILTIILFIFIITTAVYNILLTIRRLHDVGTTGWLTLLLIIPYLNIVAWIVFGCLPSEAGSNKYGTQPDVIE